MAINILANISKVYQRCLYDQIATHFENIFFKYQCGLHKIYSAQYFLLAMTEKWKENEDDGRIFGALLSDLTKAFDCILYDLIIAKLEICSFNL